MNDGGDEFVGVSSPALAEAYGEKTFSNPIMTIGLLQILLLVTKIGNPELVVCSIVLKTPLHSSLIISPIVVRGYT